MTVWDELKARGLIAQVTDEEEIKEMVNNGKATFYIGFDPTADSLHVGHFMALCLMKRLQMAGNKPIALLGGGTGMIGDPSGRSDMRQPEARILRMDADTTMSRYSYEERFQEFRQGKYDIMLGTQMIGKGLDFPNVTLVGVLSVQSLPLG